MFGFHLSPRMMLLTLLSLLVGVVVSAPVSVLAYIDAVATDHAPHAPESKDVPFDQAPPGMLGLQTALPVAWEVLSPPWAPSACSH